MPPAKLPDSIGIRRAWCLSHRLAHVGQDKNSGCRGHGGEQPHRRFLPNSIRRPWIALLWRNKEWPPMMETEPDLAKLTHRQREVLGLQLRKSTWQQFECVSIEPTAWYSFWARHGGTVAVVPTMRVCPPPDIETPAAAISGRGARPHSRHCRARRVFDIYRLHPTRAVKAHRGASKRFLRFATEPAGVSEHHQAILFRCARSIGWPQRWMQTHSQIRAGLDVDRLAPANATFTAAFSMLPHPRRR